MGMSTDKPKRHRVKRPTTTPEPPSIDLDESDLDEDLDESDYKEFLKEKKKELLLENKRTRLTTMTFHDWFIQKFKRDFKPSDKLISDAYHAGAADEIENNEYILEHTELKMQHYKKKAIKLADDVQVLVSLLGSAERKTDMDPNLKRLVRKALSELT